MVTRNYYAPCLTIMLVILIWGMYSCENGNGEQQVNSSKDVKAGESRTDTQITDLLASMNMYHFTSQVTAPDFTLTSVAGEKVSLSSYRGKVVLLSFWTTW